MSPMLAPSEDLNPDSGLRKPQLYPLSYEGTQDSPGSLPAPSIPAPRLIVRTRRR